MALTNIFGSQDINKGLEEYRTVPGAYLVDVRTPREYLDGHIPESHNVPLNELDEIQFLTDNKEASVYVYCLSGARSTQAAGILKALGYNNVKNIGGISEYSGKVVR